MNYELKVSATTACELTALVNSLAAQFGVSLSPAQAEVIAEVEAEEIKEEVKEEAPKQKRTRKAKAEVVEAAAETVEEITQDEPKKGGALNYTKQDIADACQKVSQTKNLDTAKSILAKFTAADGSACRRISDVKVEDYAAFIAECELAVG